MDTLTNLNPVHLPNAHAKTQHNADAELTRWFTQTSEKVTEKQGQISSEQMKQGQQMNVQSAWGAADLLVRHLVPAVLKQVQLEDRAQLTRRLPAMTDGASLVPARGPLAMAREALKQRAQQLRTSELKQMDARLGKALDELVWSEVQMLFAQGGWQSVWSDARVLSSTPGSWRWENLGSLVWEIVELSAWVAAVEAVVAQSEGEKGSSCDEQWSVQQVIYRRLEQLRVVVEQISHLHGDRASSETKNQQPDTTKLTFLRPAKPGTRFRNVVFGE